MSISSRIIHPRAPALHTLDAFHSSGYRLLWSANFFCYISRWMQMTLLSWFVLDLTDSPLSVALVGFFGMAPMFLLGIIGGVLSDRVDRRRLLISTQTMNLTAALAMTLILQTNAVEYWYAYIAVLVTGVGWSLEMPSRRSLIHDLMGKSRLANGIALDSVGMQASFMIGPALGGAMITSIGVSGGYVAVAIIFLISALLTWQVRTPSKALGDEQNKAKKADRTIAGRNQGFHHADKNSRARTDVLRNLIDGLRYVRGNNMIMATVVITTLMNILLFPYMQMVPVVARDVLGVGPGMMGLLMGAQGFGAFTGAILIASVGKISYPGRIYICGAMIGLLAMLLFSFSQWYFVSLVLLLLVGLGVSGFGTMQATIVMTAANEEMRGRALGVLTLAIGTYPIGILMVGTMASVTSPTLAVGLQAILGLTCLGLVAIRMPLLWGRISGETNESSMAAQNSSQKMRAAR